MNFPLIKNTTTGGKILIFLLLLIFCLVFSSIIGVFLSTIGGNGLSDLRGLQITQMCSQIIGFMLPPLLYAVLVKEKPLNYLGFKELPLWSLLGVVAMLTIIPFNGMVAEWNEGIRLPESMKGIEDMMRNIQDMATSVSMKMMNEGGLAINILIFGALAAIGEELLFRSVIQKALIKIFRNPHIGIIATAIVFSAFHGEFYGFFPRIVLGLLLGYMFYLSGSIWPSIFMHFANNSTIVLLFFMNNRGVIDIDVEKFGTTDNVFLIILSLITTVAIFMICNRFRRNNSTLNS